MGKRRLRIKKCLYCGKEFKTFTDKNYCCRECAALASRQRGEQSDSLCWDCVRAKTEQGCPWADKFLPVEGWTADATTLKTSYGEESSYHIRKCPLFVEGR